MNEGHRLHEAHDRGARASSPPAAFAVEAPRRPGRRRAARARGRARPRRDVGACARAWTRRPARRGVVLDLSRRHVRRLVDAQGAAAGAAPSSARYGTRLVLAGDPARGAAAARPHAHGRAVHARRRPRRGAGARRRARRRSAGARPARRRARPRAPARVARAQSHVKPACRKSLPAEAASTVVTVRPVGGRVQPQADERERASRRPCSACRSAARRRRSAAGARAGACRRRALLHERLADPRLDLLVDDQLRERERRGRERGDLRARGSARGRARRAAVPASSAP